MDTNSIWAMLSNIRVGQLLAWGAVIVAIITAIVKGCSRIYEIFEKYKKLKEENEQQSKMLKRHDESLNQINDSLKQINAALAIQKDVNLKQIRHTIVDSCYEALLANQIEIGRLKSLEEMYDEYVQVFEGNSYVTGLVKRVRNVPIVGTLDD